MELDQLEEREKLVRSKFDSSIKLGGDINDTGSQVVENIQTKGKIMFHLFNKKKIVYIEQVCSLDFNISELKIVKMKQFFFFFITDFLVILVL